VKAVARIEIQRGGDHAAFIDSLAALADGDFERAMNSPFIKL
jgi:hypothetical protein